MKKSKLFTTGALVLTLALGLVLAGCDTGDGGGGGGGNNNNNNGTNNPFNGTSWSGVDYDSDNVTLSFTASTWTLTYPDYGYGDNGSYTYSGNVATFTTQGVTGTATISGNNLIVVVDGTTMMTLTRGSGNPNPNPNPGGNAPSAPTGVTATAASSSSISVSWSAVSGATSYDVYYEIGSSSTKNFAGNTTNTSYTHTGLTASTTYYYYIKAKNSAGESGYSSSDSATTQSSGSGGGGNAPSAPTGVSATAASSSSITVSWYSVSGATGYYIYRSSSASGTYTQVGNSTSTSYTNTGLSASTTYYYKVAAYNSNGTGSQSSYDYATTQAAAAHETRLDQPIFGTCTRSGNNVTINWSLTTTGTTPNGLYDYVAPTSIKIEVYAEGTTWWEITTLSGTVRSYTLTNWQNWGYYVGNGQRVSLRVTCIRSGNTSTSSINTYWEGVNQWVPTY